jgi:DNA-binding MarR family transcriptional regulator
MKGWSKLLGTKEGTHEDALEPMGYVKVAVPQEGERGLKYTITASGKQALAKAQKEMAKAGKD